jgi:hypothetical protein
MLGSFVVLNVVVVVKRDSTDSGMQAMGEPNKKDRKTSRTQLVS